MIKIQTQIQADISKVWKAYNNPEDIVNWNFASEDWHCPKSENDLRVGGRFKNTMSAKDGSFSFDYSGVYDEVSEPESMRFTLDDNRKVHIEFREQGDATDMMIEFEAEQMNPEDMQKDGWFAILNNFKKYIESK